MGREVRRVPKGWEHPKNEWSGKYEPLYDGYKKDIIQFQEDIKAKGLNEALDYCGGGPVSYDYMLADCDDSYRVLYMMYESTSEGTPISPAFKTPEELARWLVDNEASSFGSDTATYEQWLPICKGAYAPSAVMIPGKGIISGVAALDTLTKQ